MAQHIIEGNTLEDLFLQAAQISNESYSASLESDGPVKHLLRTDRLNGRSSSPSYRLIMRFHADVDIDFLERFIGDSHIYATHMRFLHQERMDHLRFPTDLSGRLMTARSYLSLVRKSLTKDTILLGSMLSVGESYLEYFGDSRLYAHNGQIIMDRKPKHKEYQMLEGIMCNNLKMNPLREVWNVSEYDGKGNLKAKHSLGPKIDTTGFGPYR